jgi:hypothetical protein
VRLILTRSLGGSPADALFHDGATTTNISARHASLCIFLAPGCAHHVSGRLLLLPLRPFPTCASLIHSSSQRALHPFHSCPYQRIVVSPRLRPVFARHSPCLPISSTLAIWTCMLQPRVSVNTKSWSLVAHCINDQ